MPQQNNCSANIIRDSISTYAVDDHSRGKLVVPSWKEHAAAAMERGIYGSTDSRSIIMGTVSSCPKHLHRQQTCHLHSISPSWIGTQWPWSRMLVHGVVTLLRGRQAEVVARVCLCQLRTPAAAGRCVASRRHGPGIIAFQLWPENLCDHDTQLTSWHVYRQITSIEQHRLHFATRTDSTQLQV